jgi:hypothetical protein
MEPNQNDVTVGNPEMPSEVVLQRGLWKHAHQKRKPPFTVNGRLIADPVNPNLGRRQQVSIWYITINTNKKSPKATTKEGGASQKKTMLKRARQLDPGNPALRGWGGSKNIPDAATRLSLSKTAEDCSNLLKAVVTDLQTKRNTHVNLFAFGSNIDASKEISQKAMNGGKFKRLRQPENIGREFSKDRRLLLKDNTYNMIIKKFKVSAWEPEIAPKSGGVHCHFYLEVVHYSQLQINLQTFPILLRELWNYQCDVQGLPHHRYEGVNQHTGKLRTPNVHISLESEAQRECREDGVDIAKGNLYGNKEKA